MNEVIHDVKLPRGLSRLLYRLPILFYHGGLGWLLGKRFLLLTHTGRISGLPRQAVLEVIRFDRGRGSYYVISGFGEQADWFRNIQLTPEVEITVGHRCKEALAEILPQEDAEWELLDYARRHPLAARMLPRLLGYRVDGSEEGYRALARQLKVVRFYPRGM